MSDLTIVTPAPAAKAAVETPPPPGADVPQDRTPADPPPSADEVAGAGGSGAMIGPPRPAEAVVAAPGATARAGVDYGKLTDDLRRAADTLDRFNRKLMQVIERRAPAPAAPAEEDEA